MKATDRKVPLFFTSFMKVVYSNTRDKSFTVLLGERMDPYKFDNQTVTCNRKGIGLGHRRIFAVRKTALNR